jgi:hypothetical protein
MHRKDGSTPHFAETKALRLASRDLLGLEFRHHIAEAAELHSK